MANEKLTSLDLNLLVVLHAVLTEQSVTRAAEALGVTQPSVSQSLRRLRAHFSDELLTRVGNTYSLTPVARGLRENTGKALEAFRHVFLGESHFDPSTSFRDFLVRGVDDLAATLGVLVTEMAAKEAPDVNFRFMNVLGAGFEAELRALEETDVALLPHGVLPGIPSRAIVKDHWVCIVSSDNPMVDSELTLEHLGVLPFVLTLQSRDAPQPAFGQLKMVGIEPTVACVVDSVLALPWFVEGTDRVALVPSNIAHQFTAQHAVRVFPCPYDAVRLTVSMYWHPRHTQDPAHQWMRHLIRTAGRSVSDDEGVAALSSSTA